MPHLKMLLGGNQQGPARVRLLDNVTEVWHVCNMRICSLAWLQDQTQALLVGPSIMHFTPFGCHKQRVS